MRLRTEEPHIFHHFKRVRLRKVPTGLVLELHSMMTMSMSMTELKPVMGHVVIVHLRSNIGIFWTSSVIVSVIADCVEFCLIIVQILRILCF